ncbi:MAG TPA: amidohydrolase family protein [Stellaceae bacterium]|nr:amidohydrolase family protein [Stellaceae bacterium]
MIVDTHVHVISDDLKTYPKVADAYDWPVFTAEMYLATMDAVGIDRALLVQPYFTYRFDNSYQAEAARRHKDRFLCVCVIDAFAKNAPDVLRELVEKRGVRGVRFMRTRDHWAGDPQTFPVWECADALGIPICVAARFEELAEARAPIERHPRVKVALEHMWAGHVGDPPYTQLEPFYEFARYPNVYVKTTPNNSYAAREGRSTPKAFFGTLVERFGAKRIMWGSNYPAHWDKYAKIKERLALARQDLAFLNAEDQRWIFGETALSLWPALR